MDVFDGGVGKSAHVERVPGLLAGDVADIDVAYHGTLGAIGSFFVIEIDLQDSVGDFANGDVTEEHVFDGSSAHGVGLEAQSFVQIGTAQPAIFREHVAHSARHFAPD